MLNPNFRDILVALNDEGAEYLVVGAYAMAAHGCPRSTGDIDFWIRPTSENAARVWAALTLFGAPMDQVALKDFSTPDIVFQIGIVPQRIDVMTSISGVDFDDAWPDRVVADLDGLRAEIIGRKHLLQNKIASGRPKDIIDVEILRSDHS